MEKNTSYALLFYLIGIRGIGCPRIEISRFLDLIEGDFMATVNCCAS